MRIGLMGLGMVGGTFRDWLEKHTTHELLLFDPEKGKLNSMENADVVFINVPAPFGEKYSTNHLYEVESCMKLIPKNIIAVFVRSTVKVGTCDMLTERFGVPVYSMPEFLTERTAKEDMENLDIITGCQDNKLLDCIFENKKNIIRMKNEECEYAKLSHNAFAAIKIHFFNEMYNYCEVKKLNFTSVKEAMLGITGFFSRQHTMVPGPDGKRGFGGKCLPKDLRLWGNSTAWTDEKYSFILSENEENRKREVLP